MKNAMKKLTSLLLVAVLLVGALPFAASAATTVNVTVNGYAKTLTIDGSVVLDTETAQTLVTKSTITGATWTSPFGDATGKTLTEEGISEYNAANPDAPYTLTMSFTTAADSTTDNGAANNGTTNNGTTDNGAANNGTTNNGTTDNGTTNNGTTTTPEVKPITIVIKVDSSDNVVWTGSKLPANGEYALVENLLTYCWNSSWDGVYTFDHAWTTRTGTFNAQDVKILAGEEVHIKLKTITKPTEKPTQPTPNPGVVDEEWMKDIWLYIYVNNDIVQPAKRVLLNNYTIVNDHTLSKAEILTVVDDYYKASNANNGIIWKGAYRETTNITALDFVAGRDETTITGLDVDRSLNTVIIKARVTGVAATSSATADSSNPKTGDSIFTAMTVMGLSAASLAAVMFVYNKKRQTV